MNINYINKIIPKQGPEQYYGNKEYKRNIQIHDNLTMYKRATQMLFRINEGNGKAIYLIGIDDNGSIVGLNKKELLLSIKSIKKISNQIHAKINKIYIYLGGKGTVCSIHILLPKDKLINLQEKFLII